MPLLNVRKLTKIAIPPEVDADILFHQSPTGQVQLALSNVRHVTRLSFIGRTVVIQNHFIDGDYIAAHL